MIPQLVKDLMCREAVTIASHHTTRESAKIMIDFKLDAMMVLEDNEILGIVTIRDILNSVLTGNNSDTTSIGDIVDEKSLILVRPNTRLEDAAALMKEYETKILPVVSDDLEGFIYYEDVVDQRPELFTKRKPSKQSLGYII
jgi:CBS domain-containing protein